MKKIIMLASILVIVAIGYSFMFSKNTKKTKITSFPYENYFFEKHNGYMQYDYDIYKKAIGLEATRIHKKTRNGNLPWQQEGPYNVGGRINCIAVKPLDNNTFFIGTADGGIFKTNDGGTTYTPVFDNASTLPISCITFSPDNANILYAGTGDDVLGGFSHMGSGIYKSIDGGATWANIGLSDMGCISRIKVDHNNPQIIYAATTGSPFNLNTQRGLYKTTNGGTTWNQILYLGNNAGIADLVLDSSNTQILYATGRTRERTNTNSVVVGPAAKIYKTINGGTTWDTLTNGLPVNNDNCRIGLAISNTNTSVLYALYVGNTLDPTGLYKTTNGGATWTMINNLSSVSMGAFGWYFGNLIIDPYNNNNLYIHAVNLYKSTNAGVTWTTVSNTGAVHADKHAQVFIGNSNSYLLGTDGGLYKTTNGSAFTLKNNFPITQFYRVSYSPHDTTYYFGGAQDNGSNQGNAANSSNWTKYYGGDGFKTIFHPTDPNTQYAEWQNGNIVATDDGGINWFPLTTDLMAVDAFWWDTPYFMSYANADNIYCGSYRVFKNTTGVFPTWDTISNDLTDGITQPGFHYITALSQNTFNANKIYAGTNDGNLWKTDNDGGTWTKIIGSGLPDRFCTGITPSPNNTNNVYVCYSGYRNADSLPYLFKSTDNANTFTNIAANLPKFCINDIYIQKGHADSNIVVATDGGVYYTKDAATTWSRVGSNMPIIPVYDIDYNPSTRMLFAGTFARSMQTYPLDSLFDTPKINTNTAVANILKNNFKIYPTLANDKLIIEHDLNKMVLVDVYSMDAKLLVHIEQKNNTEIYNTSWIPNGNYIIKCSLGKNYYTKMVTVKH